MRATMSILLLQSLAEFSNFAVRKARIPANAVKTTIEAWIASCRFSRPMTVTLSPAPSPFSSMKWARRFGRRVNAHKPPAYERRWPKPSTRRARSISTSPPSTDVHQWVCLLFGLADHGTDCVRRTA
jgi:hypothetical protein